MKHRIELSIIALAIGGCVGGLYLPGIVAPALAREGVEVVLLAIALRAALRQHGSARTSWLLITAGVGLWIVGDVVWDGYDIFAAGPPAVSAADAFYLLGYPLIAAGLLVMLRKRSPRGNRDGLLDGLVLAAASTIAAWDFLIAPSSSGDLPLLQRITAASYPLGDILLLAGLAWIAFSPGRRGRATYFLFAALGLTLLFDVLYAVILSGWVSSVVGGSYPLAYALITLALLQPDAPDIVEPAECGQRAMHPARIAFLGLAVLGAPTAAIVEASRGRAAPEVLIALSITISAIVVVRFALVVHARDAAEGTLAFHATHDGLTGLVNRPILIERIEHALSLRAWRDGIALLYIDLDRFKPVNDSWGHRTGDAVLRVVAERLSSAVRPSDTVARIGGDEFVVLCEGLASQEDFVTIADRIVSSVEEPMTIDGRVIVVSASMGIARPTAATTPDSLLRDADAAMYRAKELGRNRWEVFDSALRAIVERRRSAEGALQEALSGHQLRILYQPLTRVSNGEIVGYEALLRWERPGFGLVGPDEFIPLAEETGLIIPIGTWVLEEACRQAVRWSEAAPDLAPPSVAVNLSGRQFDQPNLGEIVTRTLDASGLDPRRLVLELTESLLIQSDARSLASLERVKKCGVRIAIDDFGTGFSGLAYLRKFPFDILKIDHSFVEDLAPPEADDRIVSAVVALAHALGRTVVAEGVETPEQLAALREMGCDTAQGFLIARPLTAEAAATLYRETNGPRSKRLELHVS